MSKDDWAVVVGIQTYFDAGSLGALSGPENDAKAFHDWVTSKPGGEVPKGQAKLILSSQFKQPFPTAADAMPTADAIKDAFDHLKSVANENAENGNGLTVGDRLYIFLAGHGFAPSLDDQLTALLTAEASVANSQLQHIIGSYMADWFWRAGYFKQVLLFVDCCRSILPCTQLFKPYQDERGRDFDQLTRFYAFGARIGQESREWTPDGGVCHGVFTMTLMNGLQGAAYDPRTPKNITAESLRDYLYNDFKNFMVPGDRERSDRRKDPEVQYEQRPDSNFVVAPVPPTGIVERVIGARAKQYTRTITVAPQFVGKQAEIQDWTYNKIADLVLQATNAVPLARGTYLIKTDGAEVPFEVTGGPLEAVNVG
jgi:hypothetical protein